MPTLRDTIIPKSDQLNYDDVMTAPLTATVKSVRITSGDQPLLVYLDGIDRPYKPCKSMRRILIHCWGDDETKWPGQSLTMYGDASVKWAGKEAGGIRISHLTGIDNPVSVAITVTRGKRAPYTVKPLKAAASTPRAVKCRDWLASREIDVKEAEATIGKGLDEATDDDFRRIWKMKPANS